MSLQSKALRGYRFPPQAHDQALHNGLHCKVTKKFLAAQIINAYLCKHIFVEGVAELNFPRLKTAATMRILLVISSVVAAVFNRGQLKSSSATPSHINIVTW